MDSSVSVGGLTCCTVCGGGESSVCIAFEDYICDKRQESCGGVGGTVSNVGRVGGAFISRLVGRWPVLLYRGLTVRVCPPLKYKPCLFTCCFFESIVAKIIAHCKNYKVSK